MHRFARSFVALTVATAVFGGCYHYVPMQASAPTPSEGTPVRVHLSTPRSFDVSGYTAHEVFRVDGSFLQHDREAWVLAARSMYANGGNRFEANDWSLTVPVGSIGRAEVRTFSAWRTAVAGVAAAVGVFLASEALQGTSSSGDGGGDGEVRAVIPIP